MTRCLITSVIILSLANPASPLTFKEKVKNLEVDLNYVSQHARSIVDIVFVMDVSGSIDNNEFEESKVFFKNLLEYFSIAQGHGQVGVVTFSSTSITAIPLRVDGDKCQLVKDFTTMKRANPGSTNTVAGLNQAWKVLKTGRFQTSNSLRLVVLITDGGWNDGGDPAALIKQMKLDPGSDGGIRFLVVAVGVSPSVEAEMKSWASTIQRDPMFVYVTEYLKLAQIAYAIHNGTHESNYADVSNDECRDIGYNCEGKIGSRSSHCMCDSFGVTGMPSCGCEKGEKLISQRNYYGCTKCDQGNYQDTRNIEHLCKQCPALQVTRSTGSDSQRDCVCEPGYWDAKIKSKTPSQNGQCTKISCAADKKSELDKNNIDILGRCSYIYGEKCRYRCRSGYFNGGRLERRCTDTGIMDQTLPTCRVLRCRPLTKDKNANSWSCLYQGRPGTTSYQYGTECRSQCKSGYIPMGGTSGNLECIADTQSGSRVKWSSQPLQCEAKECPALPEIVNGYYDSPECYDSKLSRTFGKLCKSQCKTGFRASQVGSWKCGSDGRWTNKNIRVTCEDNQAPTFQNCPSDQEYPNVHLEGYYEWTVTLLSVTDNGPHNQIEQSVTIKQTSHTKQILDCTTTDCSQGVAYIGDKAHVTHTAVDHNGNMRTCKYSVTVKDQDPPSTHICEGPKTGANGIIETPTYSARVNWKEPEFYDNSNVNLSISWSHQPGSIFRAQDKYYNVTYTAEDSGGNKAYCSFSFKVVNKMKNCPPLAHPANGYLVCESEMFGYFCAVTCDKGFARISLSGARLPFDYMCKSGAWSPSDDMGACAAKSTSTGVVNIVLKDYCEDKLSKQEIIDQVIQEIQADMFRGKAARYIGSRTPEQLDKLHVFCGPKNNTLLEIDYYDY